MASAPFRIIKFWTKYVNRAGKTVPVDMIEYCAIGQAQRATTVAAVSALSKVIQGADADNVAVQMARERWEFIRPAYDAWKSNNAIPEMGIPLAAWPGVSSEQAEMLRAMGLRSVEDVAGASDGIIGRINMPGMREIRVNAQRFLDNRGPAETAAKITSIEAENAELKAQLEELRQMIIAREVDVSGDDLNPDGSEKPKRRGRPPKVVAEEAA